MKWLVQIGYKGEYNSRIHGYRTKKDAQEVMKRYIGLLRAAGWFVKTISYPASWQSSYICKPPKGVVFERVVMLRVAKVPL